MRNRDEAHHRADQNVPPVGRPRGATWRSLQADGVVWEGQVLLVGDDVDLAARMIVTHRRVVFVRGGDLVLDIPRDWLRPEPILRRDGVLDLFVAMPGGGLFDEPMTVPLRMREGHPAAGHIIAMLAPSGVRRIAPDALSGMERARVASPPPRFGGFWDDLDGQPEIASASPFAVDPPANGTQPEAGRPSQAWAPIEPPDQVTRISSTPPRRSQSTFPITGLLPRDQRRSPWPWVLRLGALTLLLATAAALGAGKLDLPIQGGGFEPILAAPTATPPATASAAVSPAAALAPSDQTALAIGVGGPAVQATAEDSAATAETESAAPPSTSPETVIPTPAIVTTPAATVESAAVATPAVATETPATVAATPAAATANQPPAVSANEAPAQEIVVGPLRLTISTALRAETLPRYGLPPGSGEWVLLTVDIANEGDEPASLAMSDFRLFDRGTGVVADLDGGTGVIATLAGLDPPRAPGDVIAVEPGETTETLLLYLLPPGSSDDLTLIVGQTSIDLAPALALQDATPSDAPALVQATVTEIIDGGRVAVDIEGMSYTVQYLGIQVPTAGACFAAESAAANAALVEGQQIWLERQATDRGDNDVLLRDVWISEPDGNRALVAARLIEAGAGTPLPVAPDTRYEAWLAASAALARTNGAGLWSGCPEAPASAGTTAADVPQLAFVSGVWRDKWSLSDR